MSDGIPGDFVETAELQAVKCSELLHRDTIHACADLLDAEADRLEKIWFDYLASGAKGHAVDYSGIPRSYADMLRRFAV